MLPVEFKTGLGGGCWVFVELLLSLCVFCLCLVYWGRKVRCISCWSVKQLCFGVFICMTGFLWKCCKELNEKLIDWMKSLLKWDCIESVHVQLFTCQTFVDARQQWLLREHCFVWFAAFLYLCLMGWMTRQMRYSLGWMGWIMDNHSLHYTCKLESRYEWRRPFLYLLLVLPC